MTNKERYQWYKENGICVSCHNQKATHGVRCERCYYKHKEYTKKYDKEVYEWRKSKGICVACGQENSVNGTNFCLVCLMDKRDKGREHYKPLEGEAKQKKAEKNLVRYYEAKEQGICVQCKTRKAINDTVFCLECGIKHKKRNERYNREVLGCTPCVLKGNGDYCSWCGKPVENKGEKLCNRCLENSLCSIQKAIANRPTDNWFAKQNKAFWAERNAKKGVK